MQTSTNQIICNNLHGRAKLQNELQSFVGMINYLPKFSARLSKPSEPIRELSKEKVPFNWGPEHQEAFNVIKKEMAKVPILPYYDHNKETILDRW